MIDAEPESLKRTYHFNLHSFSQFGCLGGSTGQVMGVLHTEKVGAVVDVFSEA